MPKSMTGFGRGLTQTDLADATWEVRSVNSRYLDIKWRLPVFLRSREQELEKVVRRFVERGRLEIVCDFQPRRPEALDVALNLPLAQAMIRSVSDLAASQGHAFTPDYTRLLAIGSLWQDSMKDAPPELFQSLEDGLAAALKDHGHSRMREGEALAADILARLAKLSNWREELAVLAPRIKEDKFEALRARLASVLEKLGVEPAEERVLQEVAVLSDKLDVTEELTRLSAHLERIAEMAARDDDVGKRMDFLIQEAFREINTCGNKAQSIEMSRIVVEFKAELEKCREQVQNLE